ncbi:MAG: polysaccharide deacetylase family protein [Planctomycetota bacterium]
MTETIMFFGFGICAVVFVYFGIPWIYAKWLRLLLKLKTSKSNTLVLTYDDGPGNRLTPAILSILAENNATATFFILSKNIAGREEIVRQIAKQGHEICSHGHDHLHYWKVSPIRAIQDIKSGWRRIDAALGTSRTKYTFRPPYGKLNIFCLLYLWIRRVPIVYWTVDMGDTLTLNPDPHRVALLAKKTGGAVALSHDFDRSHDGMDKLVLESTRSALDMAKETGMRILTVSQLLCDR